MITRLSLDGYGARRTGSFAGKAATAVVIRKYAGFIVNISRLMGR